MLMTMILFDAVQMVVSVCGMAGCCDRTTVSLGLNMVILVAAFRVNATLHTLHTCLGLSSP